MEVEAAAEEFEGCLPERFGALSRE